MLYAILCYNSEDAIATWTQEQDDAVMAKLLEAQQKLSEKKKLGPVARLKPTSSATTLRKHKEPYTITDGPYAETKEQILGFYVVDCEGREEALEFARELARVNPGGAYELRPVMYFTPGNLP